MELERRGVLITGASRGLGLALAEAMAKAGARVAMVARDGEPLERAAQAIRARGGEAYAIPGDVGVQTDAHAITGAAAALVGDIDVLIHNASTLGPLPMPLLLDTACEALSHVLAVNLVGPFRITKIIAGAMVLRGRGVVVHLSSDAAVSAYARWGAYGVSKAAQDHLNRVWSAELDGTGVRFLAVDPGEMDTRMHADAIPDADRATLARPEDVARKIVSMVTHGTAPVSGSRVEASGWEVSS